MPAANVRLPRPLVRLNPWYPGQFGVSGTANETGLREHCTGAVFYVDPNYTGVSDLRDGTDPNAPLQTVAAALTKCQDYRGDVIVVMANDAWQYGDGDSYATAINESVEVTVDGVSIIGVSPSGALGPIWRPATAGGIAITVSAMDCLIEGFCFDGFVGGAGGTAIYAEWDGVTLFGENLIVRNCTFSDSVDLAVQLEYSWNCWIVENVFQECDTYGIYIDAAGSGAAFLHILDNQFLNLGTSAMWLRGVDDSEVLRNRIYNSNAQGAALATDEGITTAGGARNMVADNYFSCVLPAGANGDWDNLNTGAATDSWIANWLTNGMAVTTPT